LTVQIKQFFARPGAYVCYPVWLRCAVLPVSTGHEIRLLRAKLVLKRPDTHDPTMGRQLDLNGRVDVNDIERTERLPAAT
jgi:hypothetical protein